MGAKDNDCPVDKNYFSGTESSVKIIGGAIPLRSAPPVVSLFFMTHYACNCSILSCKRSISAEYFVFQKNTERKESLTHHILFVTQVVTQQ